MVIVESSVICRFFLGLWAVLVQAWQESQVGNALRAFGRGITAAVCGSGVCQFLWREGAISKSWGSSMTYRVLTAVLNIPCAICKWIYRLGKKVWDGSICFRAVTAVCGNPFLLLGLFLAVMLMVPHARWDNRYALMGALALTALFAVGSGPRPKNRMEPGAFGPEYIIVIGFI